MCATRPEPAARQRGASLITAVFLITAMAVIGTLVARLSVNTQVTTAHEWLSAQALYAAESGIDWAAYRIESNAYPVPANCPDTTINVTDQPVGTNAWFSVAIEPCAIGGRNMYTIRSTGVAGGSAANPNVQRTLQVQFMASP